MMSPLHRGSLPEFIISGKHTRPFSPTWHEIHLFQLFL